MRKVIPQSNRWLAAFIIGLLVIWSATALSLAQKRPRERVAVLTFKAIGAPAEMGEAVAEILRTELVDVGKFELVERGQIEALIREQKLQMKDLFDAKTAVEIGRLSGAKLVVIGSIVKLGNTYTLNSRFIDVATGVVQIGKNIRGNSENEISIMCRQLAYIIAGKTYVEKPPSKPKKEKRLTRIPKPRRPLPKLEEKPYARIEKVWTEHNVSKGGEKGFRIHTTFSIQRHRNRTGRVSVFFRFKGHPAWLRDYDSAKNPKFSAPDGNVSTQTPFTPKYKMTRYADLKVFLPYSQLHLAKGRHNLEAVVVIRDSNKNVLTQKSAPFRVNERGNRFGQRAPGSVAGLKPLPPPRLERPSARIDKVWVDHNQYDKGLKGMWIHTAFGIHNHKGRKGRVAVFFRPQKSRTWLKDFDRDRNPQYGSPGGQATTQQTFIPKYKKAMFDDFKVFMPYSQLHLRKGKHALEAVVQIQDDKEKNLVERSIRFRYSR